MALPTFLGLGAQKCGTTWLYSCLAKHPEVYVTTARKEIHYFDRYYFKGRKWYESFFPDNPAAEGYAQWGEITPKYIYDPAVPDRIKETLGDSVKFIIMLRDPVERLFSSYRMEYSHGETDLTPEQYFKTSREAFERGLYSAQVKRYMDTFGSKNILILFYEELFPDKQKGVATLDELSRFLNIDPSGWSQGSLSRRVGSLGSSGRPKAFKFFRLAIGLRQWCMDHDLEGIVRIAKRCGISNRTFGGLDKAPMPNELLKAEVWRAYEDDVKKLGELIGKRINFWGTQSGANTAATQD